MFKFLNNLFSPPFFPDEKKKHKAFLLQRILLAMISMEFLAVLILYRLQSDSWLLPFIFAGIIMNLVIFFVMKRGHVRISSILLSIGSWLLVTWVSFRDTGLYGVVCLMGGLIIITISGALLDKRGAALMGLLTFVSIGLIVFRDYPQISAVIRTPPAFWVASLFTFAMITLVQYLNRLVVKESLERAQASEERYRMISRVSSDYVFEARIGEDGSNNLSWVSGAFERMTGYTLEEYIKAGGWANHIHPDDREKDAQDMALLASNRDVKTEVRTIMKTGEVRWERVSAHPLWDEKNNRLAGIVGAVQDITDEKNAEAALAYERELLQIFMDNIPDAVYFKDTESRFIRINQAQADFLKLKDPVDAIGKTDFDFQKPEMARLFFEEERKILETGQPVINRIEFNPEEDGAPRWISATKVIAKDSSGKTIGTIGISRNITTQKSAEETLNKSLHQQAAILNTIPDMAWLKDTDGRYIAVNEAYARTAGIPKESIVGKTDYDLWPKHLADHYQANDRKVIEKNTSLSMEEIQADSHGNEFWVKTFKTAVVNEAGEVIGTTGISRDITQHKLTEETELNRRKMLEKVLELGKVVAETTDLRTTLEKIWHGIHDGLGFDRIAIFLYDPDQHTMNDTFGTDNNGQMIDHWDLSVPIGENNAFWNILQNPDGLYFTHDYESDNNISPGHEMYGVKDFAAVAVWSGEKPVAVLCTDNMPSKRPISREQLEALRLYSSYAGLAIENARLQEALQKELASKQEFIDELASKNAELERFTYTVSHDLKSPLVTITGFLSYMEKDAKAGNFQKFEQDVLRIRSAVNKMEQLLRDLLELSRIGRIMNNPVNIPFRDIVRDAIENVQGQARAANTLINFQDGNITVYGDQIRLVEVLQNLLDNAIKFTQGHTTNPVIQIGSFTDNANETIFFVQDNGPGIAPEYHEKIFGLFNKLSTEGEGTGIGLTLVRRIIEVHGGRIWVESQAGKGTTFYFTLPLAKS